MLTFLCRLLIILGAVWILFSMVASAVRAYTLHVLDSDIHIEWKQSIIHTRLISASKRRGILESLPYTHFA